MIVLKWTSIVFGVVALVVNYITDNEHNALQSLHWFIIAMLAQVLIQLG